MRVAIAQWVLTTSAALVLMGIGAGLVFLLGFLCGGHALRREEDHKNQHFVRPRTYRDPPV